MPLSGNIIFWKNLENIRDHLLYDDKQFADFLGVDYFVYLNKKRNQSFLSMNCMFEFSEKMNIHFEDLLSKEFKLNSKITNNNSEMILSERYAIATYSKTRPILNVINYLELHRGTRAKINLLRKFQLSEEFISNPESEINILLLSDIVNFLEKIYHFKPDDFILMGKRMPFLSKNKEINDQLGQIKNLEDAYVYFMEESSKKFDVNYNYKVLNIKNNNILIEAVPNKLVIEELSIDTKMFGNENACRTRMGVISSVSWVRYKRFSPIKKVKSIYSGDTSNVYSVDISSVKSLSNSTNSLGELHATYH
ncbi:MAG: hypothetical protein ACXVLQ_12850 [Bacteriovorax sp.]